MNQETILATIKSITDQYGVPLTLIATIVQVESAWNPRALGDSGTSYGLFQLHIGGQADRAIQDGHKATDLFDPVLNAKYGMPAIASAWNSLKASFDPNNFTWWLDFGAQSGHPGGSRTNQATINEATILQKTYKQLSSVGNPPILSNQGGTGTMTVPFNARGEVADFPNVSQFEGGESAYECVAFAVAICHYAGQSGQGPSGSNEQVDQLADTWYGRLTGSIDAGNQFGMSVNQELQMILGVGNHYQQLPIEPNSMHDSDIANVKGALRLGYPVVICGAETGMYDVGLGDRVPYGWPPSGNHCIVATGIAKDGNLLVRDPANVDGNGVRPGPRTYDIARLDLISGVVFVPSWMPRPDGNIDFTKIAASPITLVTAGVPQNWNDDGTILKAPNGHTVKQGFREFILKSRNWNSADLPLEEEETLTSVEGSNPSPVPGSRQIFVNSVLEWNAALGVKQAVNVGEELFSAIQDRANVQVTLNQAQADVISLQTEVTELKTKIASTQPPTPVV